MPGPPNQPSGTHDEQIDEDERGTDMYWPGTTAAGGAAGFEAALALRVTRQEMETVAAPPIAPRPVGQALPGIQAPAVPVAADLPCAAEPDLFFAESPADVETAKALCRGCAFRIACFSGAVERREPWGVWGGELFLRGEVVPRKRPRGRPRKTEVAA
jgi:WhiB family transcriptional regulator, redox-sensing transcriptional regulator